MADTLSQPTCVGIIMDGNRRWARERSLPTLEGHRRGYEKLKNVSDWCRDRGIEHLVVYAFSTENWNRSEEEVAYLMDLFRNMVKGFEDIMKKGGRIHFCGQRERFDQDLQESMKTLEERSKEGKYHIYICLSYGGRAEILHAIKKAAQEKTPQEIADMDEKGVYEFLWTGNMPDPDIIIRTGGERRLSGFLAWQSVYSELFFTDTHWPAFTEAEFDDIIRSYGTRERRRGV
jgi:undecaprenyl diphosphate synthase